MVWKYFEEDEEEGKVKCALCSVKVFRGVGKNVTTINMRRHLESTHAKEYGGIKEHDILKKDQEKKQISLEESFNQGKKWAVDDPRSTALHYAIGEMIALDYEPYNVVDRAGFRRFVTKIKPSYQIPSRPFMSQKVVPDIYQRVKNKCKVLLEDVDWISFTTDAWTSLNSNNAFLSLTGHWIDACFNQKEIVLSVKNIVERHTGENILAEIEPILEEWKVSHKVHLFLRDCGANMIKAMQLSDFQDAPCILHIFHNVVKDSIGSQRAVKDLISRGRKIAGHFHHSNPATLAFSEILKNLNQPQKKFIQDVETRWNSTYNMLERIHELKLGIQVYAANNSGLHNLTANEWDLLPAVLSVLGCFKEMTTLFSSRESTISDVLPSIKLLKRFLSRENQDHRGVGTMKSELLNSLSSRVDCIESNVNYLTATFLDPRYQDSLFSEEEIQFIKSTLVQQILDDDRAKSSDVNSGKDSSQMESQECSFTKSSQSTLDESETNELSSRSVKRSMWQDFVNIVPKKARPDPAAPIPQDEKTRKQVLDEIDQYLRLDREDVEIMNESTGKTTRNNPVKWWGKNWKSFPHLSGMARKYLSAPASSIESERTFSEAGLVYEDQRTRLLPDHAESLVFLHHNLAKLDFDY